MLAEAKTSQFFETINQGGKQRSKKKETICLLLDPKGCCRCAREKIQSRPKCPNLEILGVKTGYKKYKSWNLFIDKHFTDKKKKYLTQLGYKVCR